MTPTQSSFLEKQLATSQRVTLHMVLLIVILGIAFLTRFLMAEYHPYFLPDSDDYMDLAYGLLTGKGYVVKGLYATRIPGYPLFIASIYFSNALAYKTIAVLTTQAAMGTLSTYLVYHIAKKLPEYHASKPQGGGSMPLDETAANKVSSCFPLLAALLAALDPLSIAFSASLLSEAPFTFLFLLAIFLIQKLTHQSRDRQGATELVTRSARSLPDGRGSENVLRSILLSLLLGLTWAAAVYMRASILWCILPLALYALWQTKERRSLLYVGLMPLLITFAALFPWQLRNYELFHEKFFRLTTLEGISLYESVYPGATGGPLQDKIKPLPQMAHMNESQRDIEWSRLAWQSIKEDPTRIARLALTKMKRTWSPTLNADEYANPKIQLALMAWHLPLYTLALLGLCTTGNPLKKRFIILLVPILYFTALHSLFLGSVRYRVPLMPLLCILAAAGITSIIRTIIQLRSSPSRNPL